jgi:hypothetical protein
VDVRGDDGAALPVGNEIAVPHAGAALDPSRVTQFA